MENLSAILESHRKWRNNDENGKRASLTYVDLTGANLTGANLTGANLCGVDLCGAVLNYADLRHANLRYANLAHASLKGANLTGAVLAEATLDYAKFTGAKLADADLAGAYLDNAIFAGACLDNAILEVANAGAVVGNMREIKSCHVEKYVASWMRSPDGVSWLQVGCQRHPLEWWINTPSAFITKYHREPWERLGPILIAMVQASPAVSWGKPNQQEAFSDE